MIGSIAKIGRSRTKLGKSRPESADFAQELANIPTIGRFRSRIGRCRSQISPIRCRSGHILPTLAEFAPDLANIAQIDRNAEVEIPPPDCSADPRKFGPAASRDARMPMRLCGKPPNCLRRQMCAVSKHATGEVFHRNAAGPNPLLDALHGSRKAPPGTSPRAARPSWRRATMAGRLRSTRGSCTPWGSCLGSTPMGTRSRWIEGGAKERARVKSEGHPEGPLIRSWRLKLLAGLPDTRSCPKTTRLLIRALAARPSCGLPGLLLCSCCEGSFNKDCENKKINTGSPANSLSFARNV